MFQLRRGCRLEYELPGVRELGAHHGTGSKKSERWQRHRPKRKAEKI
jgi:hypothetical protein